MIIIITKTLSYFNNRWKYFNLFEWDTHVPYAQA